MILVTRGPYKLAQILLARINNTVLTLYLLCAIKPSVCLRTTFVILQ